MNKFHSTISRRTFMKGLGLAGAGLGAAAATAPVFHDLDEVISAPQAGLKHPWYVKELEHGKPTVEIDWSKVVRPDKRKGYERGNRGSTHPQAIAAQAANAADVETKYMQRWFPDYKGKSLKDLAQIEASGKTARGTHANTGPSFLGFPEATTPEERGMPKWQGTPEEALRMLRSAFRLWGVSDVGCVELNANTRKLIYANDGKRTYEFEDVDQAYETDTKHVIPNKCKWVIHWTSLQPTQFTMRGVAFNSGAVGYSRLAQIAVNVLFFIRGLGYQTIDGTRGALASSNPFGALAGIGEHSRSSNVLTSYRFGNLLRGQNRIVTDLPLALTRPIDAGIARFCLTCKTCAEECPYGSLPMGDPSWEHWDPDVMQLGDYQPGYKGWRTNFLTCFQCRQCMAVCPFNRAGVALIHDVVRGTIATTSVFNSFVANMHRTFGYVLQDPESFWHNEEPTFGVDPSYL